MSGLSNFSDASESKGKEKKKTLCSCKLTARLPVSFISYIVPVDVTKIEKAKEGKHENLPALSIIVYRTGRYVPVPMVQEEIETN
jgi:hypothetical protein